jgi:hypothetical protein
MNAVLRRLLLLPVLAPLVAVVALALLNPRPVVPLRLLTWRSPPLSIGSWLAMAMAGGGLLSAAATGAALRSSGSSGVRHRVRRSAAVDRSDHNPPPGPGPRATAGPQRPPGAPPPTVEVPFRVIRRGGGHDKTASPEVRATGDGWDATPEDQW